MDKFDTCLADDETAVLMKLVPSVLLQPWAGQVDVHGQVLGDHGLELERLACLGNFERNWCWNFAQNVERGGCGGG